MNKIQKISGYVLSIINFLIISIPIVMILTWTFMDTETMKMLITHGLTQAIQVPEGGYVEMNQVHWTTLSKFVGFISGLIGYLPVFLSLLCLRKIFSNYKKTEIFNSGNAKHFNTLGWLFFLDALLAKPISGGLMVTAITLTNPPGHRYITLGFGTPNLQAVFCGVLVIVISWVMMEASKLRDEQRFVI
jgi:hypothetical protein